MVRRRTFRSKFRIALAGSLLLSIGALSAHAKNPTQISRKVSAASWAAGLSLLPDKGARVLVALSPSEGPVSALVRVSSRARAKELGLLPITDTLAVSYHSPEAWPALRAAPFVSELSVSPPLVPLLDQAGPTVKLAEAQNGSGLLGEGTVIGVIDTGIDLTHPSFVLSDGTSRVSWLLAFGTPPTGAHPDLEEEFGCLGEDPCAIFSRDELNLVLDGTSSNNVPQDRVGHGTHIASIAAGADPLYPGMAPLSDLIIVAAAGTVGAASDSRIVLGAKFIFERAAEENKPAVVNVSLGSNFGAHDGTSLMESGLAELATGPGRAVVSAAGNDGDLLSGLSEDYPEPLGVHTEVAVLQGGLVRIPILTPPISQPTTSGSVYLWISTTSGSEISVGFHNGRGQETALIAPGSVGAITSGDLADEDDYEVLLLNGENAYVNDPDASADTGDTTTQVPALDVEIDAGNIVVALSGSWETGRAFEILLKGEGTAQIWVMGLGQARGLSNGFGPLLPRARARGTVTLPGSHPDLISVGATVNRTAWTDSTGAVIGYEEDAEPGRASYSSVGPNVLGNLKPEVVSPGGAVIAAMSRDADPRNPTNVFSLFAAGDTCPDDTQCFVIDDEHALASGTSMAAPLVSGAVALMMQRDNSLTMKEARNYLLAGAATIPTPSPGSDVGAGQLDIVQSLLAQERDLGANDTRAVLHRSRVVWADTYVTPGKDRALQGFALLKDEDGSPAGDADTPFTLEIGGDGVATYQYQAPGLWALNVSAGEDAASTDLVITTRLSGKVLSTDVLPVERDAALAAHGFEVAGGVCSVSQLAGDGVPRSLDFTLGFGLLWALSLARRRAPLNA